MTAPQTPLPLRGGFITRDPRLDRIPQDDPRNLDFPARRLIAPNLSPRSYTWPVGKNAVRQLFLDQGQEGECVGYSFAHELAAKPIIVKGVTAATAHDNYIGAQNWDEWAGSDYEGSSVLGGVKYLTNVKKYYLSYAWARDTLELAVTVSRKGPCVLGIAMYEGMMDPDADGFLNITGNMVGGHAILCKGYSLRRQAFLLHNSWGQSWGLNGTAWLRGADMTTLFAQDAEACIPLRNAYQQEVIW